MKRILPFALICLSGAWVYACSSDSSSNNGTDTPDASDTDTSTNPPPGQDANPPPQQDGGSDADAAPPSDPIQGIAAPAVVGDLGAGAFVDGPQWKEDEHLLYFSLPTASNGGQTGLLVKYNPDGGVAPNPVRGGDGITSGVVGNSVDKNGALISAERKKVTRTLPDGGAVDIATTFMADGGSFPFDTANDLVSRKDGTIYVTDPGYFDGTATVNHLVKIAPDGGATLLQNYDLLPRPNGIALSPDEKTLYVGFTLDPMGTDKPYVMKYTVATDGSVSNPTKFVELAAGATPDGIAVDTQGNVYVAVKKGVDVFKADGTRYGADPSIPIPVADQGAVGVAFGGTDHRSLYITTEQGKIYRTKVNIAGLIQ